MQYNIDYVIKRLEKAKKDGKELITADELMCIATPKINNIDAQIKLINRGLNMLKQNQMDSFSYSRIGEYITFSIAENITGIPRKTFFRWKKNGIITTKKNGKREVFRLSELREKLLSIKSLRM
jgi:hypothetical protein